MPKKKEATAEEKPKKKAKGNGKYGVSPGEFIDGVYYYGMDLDWYNPDYPVKHWQIGWVTEIYYRANQRAFDGEENAADCEDLIRDAAKEMDVDVEKAESPTDKVALALQMTFRRELKMHRNRLNLGDVPRIMSSYMPWLIHPEKIQAMLVLIDAEGHAEEERERFENPDAYVPQESSEVPF